MDQYLNQNECTRRLIKEWIQYKKLIIAVDFDNTVFDYHNENKGYTDVIELLKKCKNYGCYIMIFTANDNPEHHGFIKEYMSRIGVPIDTINENLHCVPFSTKKPYYNLLLDDRAGLPSAFDSLQRALEYLTDDKEYCGICTSLQLLENSKYTCNNNQMQHLNEQDLKIEYPSIDQCELFEFRKDD